MSKLKMIGTFVGGLCLGGLITGYVVKNKYEEILKEEIQSVKDTYKNRQSIGEYLDSRESRVTESIEECEVEKVATTDDIKEYNKNKNKQEKTDYTKYSKKTTEIVKEEVVTEDGFKEYKEVINTEVANYIPPTLIDEEEVGMHGFDMQVLTYYSDGVLVDDIDEVVDVETYVGFDNIRLFEETGCSSIFVRNEQLFLDFEVQKDDMTWGDFCDQFDVE